MKDKRKRKKGKGYLVFPALLFFCGLALLVYPFYTDWKYRRTVQNQREAFERQVGEEASKNNEMKGKTEELPFEALYQELKQRNETLWLEHQKNLTDPWAYEQPGIDLTAYGLTGNTIGFLSIPKMEVELPILLGANRENMALGAVHLTETSYPIGGDNTNCIIAAHRGYSETAMFRDIEKLEPGDEIYIENFRERLVYEAVEIRVIDPTDIGELLIQEGRDMVTLITCHPYRHNYQRYVVFCERKKGADYK